MENLTIEQELIEGNLALMTVKTNGVVTGTMYVRGFDAETMRTLRESRIKELEDILAGTAENPNNLKITREDIDRIKKEFDLV